MLTGSEPGAGTRFKVLYLSLFEVGGSFHNHFDIPAKSWDVSIRTPKLSEIMIYAFHGVV